MKTIAGELCTLNWFNL